MSPVRAEIDTTSQREPRLSTPQLSGPTTEDRFARASAIPSRLPFLDGMRGLAALYVALFHTSQEVLASPAGARVHPVLAATARLFAHGADAVCVFIVLSGFCLALPLARASEPSRLSFRHFMGRRARRILPPYYAAVALSLLLIACVPALHNFSGTRNDRALPAFTAGAIGSHLLLIHNLDPGWHLKINGPLWSVATEWQLYFAVPLLIPLCRRFGVLAMLAAAFALGPLPYALRPHSAFLVQACPWYLFLFALGIGSAFLCAVPAPHQERALRRIPWGLIGLAAFGVMGLLAARVDLDLIPGGIGAIARAAAGWWQLPEWLHDSLVGLATVCLIMAGTLAIQSEVEAGPPIYLRALSARYTAGLGAFSYSLYLMHSPLIGAFYGEIQGRGWTPSTQLMALLFVGLPIAVGAAYLFHLAFERPFLRKTPASKTTWRD